MEIQKEYEKSVKNFEVSIDQEKSKKHYKILIEGEEIYFPYDPYPAQIKYMANIIQTLKHGNNISALESPTGTGKTLCLLCSIFGWLYHNNKRNIKNIYYCTRTVEEINNVLNELQKTCYIIKNSFLVSRKFSCLFMDKKIKSICDDTDIISELCRKSINGKNNLLCQYYKNNFFGYEEYKKFDKLTDIEDLFKNGKEEFFCPYYYSINKTKKYANITLMSYNYILNPHIRNKLNLIEKNSIIILDEAHNICNVFENLFTNKLDKKNFKEIKESLLIILNIINDEDMFEKINHEINKLIKFIKNLDETEKKMIIKDNKLIICSLNEFKNIFFTKFNIEFYNKIDKISNNLITEKIKVLDIKKLNNIKLIYKSIKKIISFLEMLQEINEEDILSYKFTISIEEKNVVTFGIYCIDASIVMKDFMKNVEPYSLILTSGTLSIINLENLLQIKFYKKLNNSHVINNNQFLMNVIAGNEKINFSFTYGNRNNEAQIISLGKEIKNLSLSVKKGGILIFFQSYEYLKYCYYFWSKTNIFKELYKNKLIIFDIKQKYDNNLVDKKNKNKILFTVYRGKNSEGVNFIDDEARMVICVGIPYPNILDIKVQLKKIFLEEKNKNGISEYNSNQWCKEEAFIAINQSLGRLIRHKDDYGIMICFGNEFKDNSLFTEWIKQNEKIIQLKDNNKEYYKELENYLLYMDKNDKYYKCFKTIIDLDNSSSEDIMYEYDNSYESDDIENDCYDEENEYE